MESHDQRRALGHALSEREERALEGLCPLPTPILRGPEQTMPMGTASPPPGWPLLLQKIKLTPLKKKMDTTHQILVPTTSVCSLVLHQYYRIISVIISK